MQANFSMQFLDLKLQYQSIKKEIDTVVKQVLNSGVFVGGEEVENLEKKIAKFCGVKYAVALNSGTDALLLSLKAFGVSAGDEVITTPFTFIATAEVIANLGAKPVFVDIKSDTFNIDCSKIEKAITKKTKAIIPVHLFGQMAKMTSIMSIAKKYNLKVIEDACQAIGAKLKTQNSKLKTTTKNLKLNNKWQMAGSIGNIGCFSFFPSKNLGACGDGGMVITNNKQLADKIQLLRNHGSSPKDKYLNLVLGTNSRLDAIQAAILRVKLKYLNQWNTKRQQIAQKYNESLKNIKQIQLPIVKLLNCQTAKNNKQFNNTIIEQFHHIFHQYTVRIKNRDALKYYLERENIPTMIYFPRPLHLQPALRYLGYKQGDFKEAEKAAREVLSLSIFPELGEKEQNLIIKKIKDFYGKTK